MNHLKISDLHSTTCDLTIITGSTMSYTPGDWGYRWKLIAYTQSASLALLLSWSWVVPRMVEALAYPALQPQPSCSGATLTPLQTGSSRCTAMTLCDRKSHQPLADES